MPRLPYKPNRGPLRRSAKPPKKSAAAIPGRLSVHRDGYGFVIPDEPIEGLRGDIYIAKEGAQRAMHGDRVTVRILRIEPDGRADGDIVEVLRRAHPSGVGGFRVRGRGAAQRGRAHQVAVETVENLDGMIVKAESPHLGEKGDRPVGRIVEILG